MWIDFKLYFYVSNHKKQRYFICFKSVVNWFQIVFLREQSQVVNCLPSFQIGCELISNCIFTWAITSELKAKSLIGLLWIDFKLYFYVSNHKLEVVLSRTYPVVNWFQIVFLREQSQDFKDATISYFSCELISNCIFTWAITSIEISAFTPLPLWIDFKLYFYVSNHKLWDG